MYRVPTMTFNLYVCYLQLVDKNLHWQVFNADRERTVVALRETIQRLEARSREGTHQCCCSCERGASPTERSLGEGERFERLAESRLVEFDNLMLQQKKKVGELEDEKREVFGFIDVHEWLV